MNPELERHLQKNRMRYHDSLPPNVRFVINYVNMPILAMMMIQRKFPDIRKPGKATLIEFLKSEGFHFIDKDIQI